MNYEIEHCNGCQIIYTPVKDSLNTFILFLIKVGSVNEDTHNIGICHVLEHMLFRGTKKRPSFAKIVKFFDQHGASWNAFTNKENTGYHVKIIHNKAKEAFEVMGDILRNSQLSTDKINKEKAIINEEFRASLDNHADLGIDILFQSLFRESSLKNNIIGSFDRIKQFHPDTIRYYYRKYYHSKNMIISISGKITPELKKQVSRFCKLSMSATMKQYPTKKNKSQQLRRYQDDQQKLFSHYIIYKKINFYFYKQTDNQTKLFFGWKIPGYRSKLRNYYTLLSEILGGSPSSRLYQKLRSKHALVYTIRSACYFYGKAGAFVIQTQLEPKNVKRAVHLICKEIQRLQTRPVKQKEIKDAISSIHGNLFLSMEDTDTIGSYYATELFYKLQANKQKQSKQLCDTQDSTITIESFQQFIEQLTEKNYPRQKLFQCAKQLTFPKMTLVVIGNHTDKQIKQYIRKSLQKK